MRRKQIAMVLGMAAAVTVGVWVWPPSSPGGQAGGLELGDSGRGDSARRDANVEDSEPGRVRTLEVQVEGCRGPAGGALVFAYGPGGLVSAEADAQGRARLVVGEGALEVSARVAGWESPRVQVGNSLVVVSACVGATLHGRVLDETGTTREGLVLTLVDAQGQHLDEAVTGPDGRYELLDPGLEAQAIVLEGEADGTREIEALRAGERRELDLIVGAVREIAGWVLDMSGDPQAGVPVTLAAEAGGSRWYTVTDGGGAFSFLDVPATPIRVTADGGDLGMSSARLARTSDERREVTLVLEPTTTLVVYADPKVGGQVIVRSWSAGAHGEDEVWVDDKRPLNEVYGEGPYPESEPYVLDEGAVDGVPEGEDALAEMEPRLQQMEELMGRALLEFDAEDPEASLARLALGMLEVEPALADELRRDAEKVDPALAGAPIEEIARVAAKKVIEEEPNVVETMRLAAEKMASGSSALEALMGASAEIQQGQAQEAPPASEIEMLEDQATATELDEATPVAEPWVGPEPVVEGEGGGELAYFEDPPVSPENEGMARWTELLGSEEVIFAGEERAVVARGGVGQEIPVRGALRYHIAIRLERPGEPEGYELNCGEVLAVAGETMEIQCGTRGETVVMGRAVDLEGRPIAGLKASMFAGGSEAEATTDEAGRFELRAELSVAFPCEMVVSDPTEERRASSRRSLGCSPGQTVEVGDVVVRREDEAPVSFMTEPFGGVGAGLSMGPEGIVLDFVGEEGPLAMEGVEGGATILRVDDEDATTWSMDDMLMRLRGDVGTEVFLRLRSREGELYETTVERGLITPEQPIYEY